MYDYLTFFTNIKLLLSYFIMVITSITDIFMSMDTRF